jgi:outer membrane protein assembly factor BamB
MTLKRLGTWGAAVAAVGLLGACRTVALGSDPLTNSPTRPNAELFRVDWWRPLTGSLKLLEYAPREPAAPTVDAERKQVITLTRDGVVRAHGFDGEPRWETKTGTFFSASAGVDEGRVYVPGGNGDLIALDAETGKKLWSYATGVELGSAPVQAQGLVIVASHADSVFAVDAATGAWKWQYRRDSPSGFTTRGISQPTIRGDLVYLGFADGTLAALRLKDGAPKWERMLSTSTGPFIDVDTQPVFDARGTLYAASAKDGVFALDADTGNPLWKSSVTGVTHLLVRGDLLFAAGAGKLSSLTAADGGSLWSLPLGEDAAGKPVMTGGILVVPLGSALLFVDPGLGQGVLRWDPGQGVSAPAALDGGNVDLFVLSNLGFLYALDLVGTRG